MSRSGSAIGLTASIHAGTTNRPRSSTSLMQIGTTPRWAWSGGITTYIPASPEENWGNGGSRLSQRYLVGAFWLERQFQWNYFLPIIRNITRETPVHYGQFGGSFMQFRPWLCSVLLPLP